MKLHEQIAACLDGSIDHDALPAALQSAIRLPVYNLACHVLRAHKGARAARLQAIPPTIRPQVEDEARRLFYYRKDLYHL